MSAQEPMVMHHYSPDAQAMGDCKVCGRLEGGAFHIQAASAQEPVTVRVDVVSGVEGPSLYFDDYRVDGPKPWGGGRILHTFTVLVSDIRAAASATARAEAAEAALSACQEVLDRLDRLTRG